MKHIPNILTVIRLFMIPVFVAAFAAFPEHPGIALAVYAFAMLTDAVDGRIARACNCVSRFGTLIDPLADKLMTLSAVICLAWSRIIPIPAMFLVAFREISMIAVAAYAVKRDIVIAACWPGKISTLLFTAALILLIPWHGIGYVQEFARYLLYAAIALAYYAEAFYTRILFSRMSDLKKAAV